MKLPEHEAVKDIFGNSATETVEFCDLCGSSLADAPPLAGVEHLPVVRCRQCSLVITSPRPTAESLGDFYPSDYYSYVPGEPTKAQKFIGKLKQYRGGYPSRDFLPMRLFWTAMSRIFGGLFLTSLPYYGAQRRLLDVGCGWGKQLLWAKGLGWEVDGVEWSETAVTAARAAGLSSVRAGSLEEQGFADDSFDAVTLYQTLEHLPSPSDALSEICRILKPGGTAWVSVPNVESGARRLLGERWYAWFLPIHLHHFGPETLSTIAANSGLEVVRVHHCSRLLTGYSTVRTLMGATSSPLSRKVLRAVRNPGMAWDPDIIMLEAKKPAKS